MIKLGGRLRLRFTRMCNLQPLGNTVLKAGIVLDFLSHFQIALQTCMNSSTQTQELLCILHPQEQNLMHLVIRPCLQCDNSGIFFCFLVSKV